MKMLLLDSAHHDRTHTESVGHHYKDSKGLMRSYDGPPNYVTATPANVDRFRYVTSN